MTDTPAAEQQHEAMSELRRRLLTLTHAEYVHPYDMTDEEREAYYTDGGFDPSDLNEEWND
jgi:hypothetical protein